MGEDIDSPNAKIWKVQALHVTTTRNKRKFTREELHVSARSLSFRPLNINHDSSRALPFPENATRAMHFNPATMAVEGTFRVTDPAVNAMIETGRINSVSIEQIPTLGETCNEVLCEQHGVAFIGMALLEADVIPGDPSTANAIHAESFVELLISDEQRTCTECTDHTLCTSCQHTHDKENLKIEETVKKITEGDKSKTKDQAIALALTEIHPKGLNIGKARYFYYQGEQAWQKAYSN